MIHGPDELEIEPPALRPRLDAGDPIALVDCREVEEWAICHLDGAALIPMREIVGHVDRLRDLADASPVVVYCHHGVRSLMVTRWLRQQGIENVVSLAGGIDRWSREIDDSIARY